jgi:hypothetical protein
VVARDAQLFAGGIEIRNHQIDQVLVSRGVVLAR